MKRMALLGHGHHNCLTSLVVQNSFLSDDQIIQLHTVLLTPGFHHLYVMDIQEGRSILSTFLPSLQYYCDIACLTCVSAPLNPQTFDLYSYLKHDGYLDPAHTKDLEDFLLNHFENDFLWIEATSDLLRQPWFLYFEQKLIELRIDHHIPIMVISYEQDHIV